MQEKIVAIVKQSLPYAIRYRYILIGSVIIGIFGFAALRIDTALQIDRDENVFEAKRAEVKPITFDEEAIEEIRRLKDAGVDIESNFPTNRNNPFR